MRCSSFPSLAVGLLAKISTPQGVDKSTQFCFHITTPYKQVCGVASKNKKMSIARHLLASFYFCGKRGIRTPETLLGFTRFPGGPVQPLLHLSFYEGKDSIFYKKSQPSTIKISARTTLQAHRSIDPLCGSCHCRDVSAHSSTLRR